MSALIGVVSSLAMVAPVGAAEAAVPELYPTPEDGIFRMVGAGWGHGRGMSQWGAYQAAREGRTHAEILSFYYPGTTLAEGPSTTVRVLLASDTGNDLVVRAVPGLWAAYRKPAASITREMPTIPKTCRTVPATRWRVRAQAAGVTIDAYCGEWRTALSTAALAPDTSVTFWVPGGLVGTQVGTVRTGYRGKVVAQRVSATSVRVVNLVTMETYLRAVVPAESPPSWPAAALRAQAIAARTFAAREMRGRSGYPFDVYDSVRSQAYPGAVSYDWAWQVTRRREFASTDAAVAATARVRVIAGDLPALTQFSSSNGGASARTIVSYMVGRADPWDARATANPRRSWTDTISAEALRRRFPGAGEIVGVEVLAREGVGQWGGRIASLRIVGVTRSYTLTSDDAIRSVLGVNSSYLTFLRPVAPTPSPTAGRA